jgi:hypothetical protein
MRIALVHAVPMAVAPVAAAFDAHWPEAERKPKRLLSYNRR